MLLHFEVQYVVCYWFGYFAGERQMQRTWSNQRIRTGSDWCYDNRSCRWRSCWNSNWSIIKYIAVGKRNENVNYVVWLSLVLSRFYNISQWENVIFRWNDNISFVSQGPCELYSHSATSMKQWSTCRYMYVAPLGYIIMTACQPDIPYTDVHA